MTVEELVGILQEFEPNQEVMLAQQPSWPFEYSIGQVVCADPRDDYEVLQDDQGWAVYHYGEGKPLSDYYDEAVGAEQALDDMVLKHDTEHIVYISESTQVRYLPGHVSRALGWR